MKNTLLSSLVSCVVLLLVTNPVMAGKPTINDVASQPEKKLMKMVKVGVNGKPNKKGEGPVPRFPAGGSPPERVGILTFFIQDTGKQEAKVYSNFSSSSELTGAGVNHFAARFYDESLQVIRDNFSEHGMTVLTTDEYLDTPEKEEAYHTFEMKHGFIMRGLIKYVKALDGWNQRAWAIRHGVTSLMGEAGTMKSATPDGYRIFPIEMIGQDGKSTDSINDLREAVGVDAFLGVLIQTQYNGKELILRNLWMYVYGPNPTEKIPGTRYIQWRTGQRWAETEMRMKPPPTVAKFKKGKIISEDYTGFDKLMSANSKTIAQYLAKVSAGN